MRKYDSTVARMAGNIASGLGWHALSELPDEQIAGVCVQVARAIVAEVQRTDPPIEAPTLSLPRDPDLR